MENVIRLIKLSDAKQVLTIYKPYIENTAISFETEIPNLKTFTKRIETTSNFYPWLVYEENKKILGYAYATSHRQRDAYKWSVDVAIYIKEEAHGKGIGKRLYSKLFDLLMKQGFYNAYAGIALPNEKSIGIHEKIGFSKIAEYHNVGFKLGKWWNVGWWEMELLKPNSSPSVPIGIHDVK